MPKINPIDVFLRGKGQNHFSHKYETHVLSDGTFQTLIPENQVEIIAKLDLTGVELTKNKVKQPILKARNLADIVRVVTEYGRSTLEVTTTKETLIFYKVSLDAAYCINPKVPGEAYPNGYRAKEVTGGENDYRWQGADRSNGRPGKHAVGVSAIVIDKTINHLSGGRFHVEHARAQLPEGSFGSLLNDFNGGVFPPNDYWSATDPNTPRFPPGKNFQGDFLISDALQFLPYTEQSAEFFYQMMMNIAKLSERMRLFFGDSAEHFLENLNNEQARKLLGAK